jgi:hypothetical protein
MEAVVSEVSDQRLGSLAGPGRAGAATVIAEKEPLDDPDETTEHAQPGRLP